MPGETSKKSGEYGEDIGKKLFALIGWSDLPNGYDINCFNGVYHKISESNRKTHGVDLSCNYESNLITNRQECVVISVKYREKYSSNPTSEFKDYLRELTFTMDCFRYSEQYKQSVSTNIDSKNLSGIIVWLSRDVNYKRNIIEEIKDFRLSDGLEYGPVYLIDNLHASFLFSVIQKCKLLYKGNYSFIYQTTGSNLSSISRKSFGTKLPIEQINSPILLIKGSNKRDDVLNIFCISKFSEDNLKRLIGLSRDITEQWASKIIIYFIDYNKLKNEVSVNTVKALFSDKDLTEKVQVKRLSIVTFRELETDDGE